MLLVMILCIMIPGSLFGYLSLQQVEEKLYQETTRRMRLQSREISLAIHGAFSDIHSQVEFLAGVLRNGTLSSPRSVSERDGLFAGWPLLGATRFRYGSRAEPLFGNPCPQPPGTSAARSHLASGQSLLYLQRVAGGAFRFFLAHTVRGNTPEQEVLACEVNPDRLWRRVRDATPPVSEVAVLSPDGTPLFQTNPFPPAVLERVVRERSKGQTGTFEWGEGPDALLVDLAAVFLKPAFNSEEWTVVVSKHRSDALAVAKRFTRLLLLSIALIALAAGLFAHVQVRRNIAPLGVLEEGTRRISEGDFQSRVEIRSGDEFEDLARSFNTMADRLGKEFRVQAEMGRIVQMILGETAREKIVETLLGNVDSVVPCDGSGLFLFDGKAKEDGTIAFLREAGSAAASQKSGTGLLLSGEAIRRLTSVETSMVVEARGEFGDFLSPWTEPRPSAFLLAPVVSGGELQGALLLGYREFPDASRETLIRLRQIADQAAIALNRARLLEELTENDLGTLQALARTVDTNSPWTAGHSQRVTALAMDIGRKMGLQQQELDLLHRGGLLHDLGKIGISPSILEKPGKLTEEEFAVMRRHPSAGASILGPIPNLQKVIPIVSQHHERFDGKGYPNGLSGEAISLHARILALADVWDALSSVRPYRPGWPRKAVIAHLRENAGLHFDPAVVEVFLDIEAQWYAAAAAESSGDPAADPPAVLHRQDARRTAPSMQTAACGTAECPVSGYSEPFLRG